MSKTKCFLLSLCYVLAIFTACKKKDIAPQSVQNTAPVKIADSSIKVTFAQYKDINDYAISYEINPAQGETFNDIYLVWSRSSDFSTMKDSILLSSKISSKYAATHLLIDLKDTTTYYAKLSMTFKGTYFSSAPLNWKTERLVIWRMMNKLIRYPFFFAKGTTISINTSFFKVPAITSNIKSKISLGGYNCPVVRDEGDIIYFDVPGTIPEGRYSLKLEKKGIVTQTPDSIFISRGEWLKLNSPDYPLGNLGEINALGDYGTASSATRGYVLGGSFLYRMPEITGRQWHRPDFILEFNPTNATWVKKVMPNPRFFDHPNCFFYNNSLYVLGGSEREWGESWIGPVNKMLKLDLSTLLWTELDQMPMGSKLSQVSFELNGEWYIGLGMRFISVQTNEEVSKTFWKYNPATNVWTRIADFPGGFHKFPTAFVNNGKAYLFLGQVSKQAPNVPTYGELEYSRQLWEYDPVANSWKNIPLPAQGGPLSGEKYSIACQNGKAYFMTGQQVQLGVAYYYYAVRESFLEYDVAANNFTQISYPINSIIMKPVFQGNNALYFLGDKFGYTETVYRDVWQFKPE